MKLTNLKSPLKDRPAFTLIEVMIALTVSLLIMAAVAKLFNSIGREISRSQAELGLSTDLRDIARRLRAELEPNRLTMSSNLDPPADPAAGPNGYVVYHEGPMTSETLTHIELTSIANLSGRDYFVSNRYGDLDDYVAFTTRAETGKSFVGYIPRGVLAAMEVERLRAAGRPNYNIPGYTAADAIELVPFYSDTAEVAYFLSPAWDRYRDSNPANGTLRYRDGEIIGTPPATESGYPMYRDVVGSIAGNTVDGKVNPNDGVVDSGDLVPDVMNLHRRVLLVRDDLNLTLAEMNTANSITGVTPLHGEDVLPFLLPSGGGLQQIVPMFSLTATDPNFFDTAATNHPAVPGNWFAGTTDVSPAWLTGLARMQQIMDLSISRVTDNWTPAYSPTDTTTSPTSSYGMPSVYVRANSISNLTRPENRFAHVRVPGGLFAPSNAVIGNTNVHSSMPQLALCPPHPFMTRAEHLAHVGITPTTGPFGNRILRNLGAAADPDGYSAAATANAAPTITGAIDQTDFHSAYGRFTMTGFVRPEFILSDRMAVPNIATTGGPGPGGEAVIQTRRGGTDIVLRDVLAFDVKIYDANAPSFLWVGSDGAEGFPGDDDGDLQHSAGAGTNDVFDVDELGWVGSDDEMVRLSDLNARLPYLVRGGDATADVAAADLFTPIQTGAFVDLHFPLLAGHPFGGIREALNNTARTNRFRALNLDTPFSGIDPGSPLLQLSTDIIDSATPVINRGVAAPAAGQPPLVNSFIQHRFDTWTDDYDGDGFDQEGNAYNGFSENSYGDVATNFSLQSADETATGFPPTAENFAVTIPSRTWSNRVEQDASQVRQPGADPRPTSPPVDAPMTGLQIRIRLYDRETGQIRQQTIESTF